MRYKVAGSDAGSDPVTGHLSEAAPLDRLQHQRLGATMAFGLMFRYMAIALAGVFDGVEVPKAPGFAALVSVRVIRALAAAGRVNVTDLERTTLPSFLTRIVAVYASEPPFSRRSPMGSMRAGGSIPGAIQASFGATKVNGPDETQ